MKLRVLQKLLFFMSVLLIIYSCSSSKYQVIIGKPYMLSSKSILVAPIIGLDEFRSQENFQLLKKALSKNFKSIKYLPSHEYDLLKNGLSREQINKIGNDRDVDNLTSQYLNVEYLFQMSVDDNYDNLTSAKMYNPKNYYKNDIPFTFKISDLDQGFKISEFLISVKFVTNKFLIGVWYESQENLEAQAIRRAAKEIIKIRIDK